MGIIFVLSLHLEGIYFPCFTVDSIILAFQRYSESDARGISMGFRVLLAHVRYLLYITELFAYGWIRFDVP